MTHRHFTTVLGANIRRSRESKGWTQRDLSIAINATVNTVSSIERGLSTPSSFLLLLISNALEVELKELTSDAQAAAAA